MVQVRKYFHSTFYNASLFTANLKKCRAIQKILNEDSDTDPGVCGHPGEKCSDRGKISNCEEQHWIVGRLWGTGSVIQASSSESDDGHMAGPSQTNY